MTSLDPRVCFKLVDIELDLVATFMRLAKKSPNEQTRMRNQAYAREAYQMACRYRSQLNTADEAIQAKFSDAELELEAARPVFDR